MKILHCILPLIAIIFSFSAQSQCVFDSDCDDGIICTADICNAPNCINTQSNALCDDGFHCTTDVCSNFQCVHTPNNAACTDGNPCNGVESCNPISGCQVTPFTCDDGSVCNGLETCDTLLGCQAGTPLPSCDDGDPCNGLEFCNPTLGCRAGTPLTTSVSIGALPIMPNCNGAVQTVTFTATPVNGGVPVYQWKKNGNNVGTNSNAYASATLLNGDQVWCEMTSSAACFAGLTVTSNIITVTMFDRPFVTITATPASSCCTGQGTALANTSSGNPPYDYMWNNNRTTQLITSLYEGTYRVTVKDAQGCTATASATVNDQVPGISATFSVTNPDCLGNPGSATVNPAGGQSPYTFRWSNGSTSQTINNISGYYYGVTVTDAFMCYRTAGTNLTHPPQIAISANTMNVTCNGQSDGAIQLTATGGTPGYNYLWNTGNTSMNLNAIPVGNYSVTVTDTNGCSATANRNIFEPTEFSGTVTAVPLNCFGSNDGSAVLFASGGTSPYTKLWSTGETTWSIGNLSAGTYCATATDANGCSFDACETISQPQQIMLSATATPPQIQTGQSSNLSVTGCSGCTYTWSPATGLNNSGIPNPVASPAATAIYTVISTGADGCTASVSVIVTVGSDLVISGIIKTETGVFIPGVSVDLTGTISGSDITAPYPGDGLYSFGAATNGNYTVTPSKNDDISVINGISTLDILMIRSHILSNLSLNSPYKIIAADVSASASVSTSDVLLIRSLILGNTQSFPGGRLWTFVSSDFIIADPQTPFPYDNFRSYTNLPSSLISQDFIGIKLGDVNNSWNPATPKTDAIGRVHFAMDEYSALPGSEVVVSMRLKDFRDITGYQFTLTWDATVLSLLKVNNKALSGYYGEHSKEEGLLTTLWYDEACSAKTLDDDAVAFELKFKVTGAIGTQSKIKIGSEFTASEAYNENLDLLNIAAQNGVVKVGDNSSIVNQQSTIYNLQVQPNPFTNTTNIVFTIPQDKEVTLSIYDILGKEVKQVSGAFKAGINTIEWAGDDRSGSQLSNGLYHIRMTVEKEVLTGKAMIIR